jgi:Domain of unknown function (DUF222)/HNH endonuclease
VTTSASLQCFLAALDRLALPVDLDELATVLAARDRLDARIAAGVRAVDAAGLWDGAGATSMTAWLAERGRMARGRAALAVRVARLVGRLPGVAAAWGDGRLSTGQVETICLFLTDTTVEVLAGHEAELIPVLVPLGVRDVAAALRTWQAHLDGADPAERPGALHVSRSLEGRTRLDGDLDPDTGELVVTALRVATQASPQEAGAPARAPGQRRADALGDICRFYLDHQNAVPDGQRHRPHVNLVFTTAPTPGGGFAVADAQTLDGHRLDRVTAGRYLCDSLLYRVLVRERSAIVDYGRATRAVPPPLWNLLLVRDRHCRWPGCDRPGHWGEAHHITPREHGGTTGPANLVILCTRHHHILHRPGWHAHLDPDGTLTITDPHHTPRTTRPPATGPPLPTAA